VVQRPYRGTTQGEKVISLTERAIEKIKEIADAEGLEGQAVRLKVIGGGCAGFTYDMAFDNQIGDLDEEFEVGGIKLISDPLSLQYLEEVEIDYLESPLGGGFKFNNPQVKSTCGCGSSFSV
jgi:iron-sulfur cluster insertion protein